MTSEVAARVEQLRQQGLAQIKANRNFEAIAFFDAALALCDDEATRELLTLNKAGSLIAAGVDGAEIQELPRILMRRRNERHAYLAAYYLRRKFQNEKDFKRAAFYARITLEAAEKAGERGWQAESLIALGNLSTFDSQNEEAIGHYEAALALLEPEPADGLRRLIALQNLGYCRLLLDRTEEGIALIHRALELMRENGAEAFAAESYIDLCYGYLEQGDLENARLYGERGLEAATGDRQVRNAHFLLGETAYTAGDIATAESHFELLGKFYPDFPHLKDVLFALDLRGMVNLKL